MRGWQKLTDRLRHRGFNAPVLQMTFHSNSECTRRCPRIELRQYPKATRQVNNLVRFIAAQSGSEKTVQIVGAPFESASRFHCG